MYLVKCTLLHLIIWMCCRFSFIIWKHKRKSKPTATWKKLLWSARGATFCKDSSRKVYPLKHCSRNRGSVTLTCIPSNIKLGVYLINLGQGCVRFLKRIFNYSMLIVSSPARNETQWHAYERELGISVQIVFPAINWIQKLIN